MKEIIKIYASAHQLSLPFLFKMFCGFTIVANASILDGREREKAVDSKENTSPCYPIMLVFGMKCVFSATQQIKVNYTEYLKAALLLGKYGCRPQWMRHFIISPCGRAQVLKAIGKNNQDLAKYKQYYIKKRITIFHMGSTRAEYLIPAEIALAGGLAGASSYAVFKNKVFVAKP